MQIYISEITYNNSPLIWEYVKQENTVVCKLKTINSDAELDVHQVYQQLSENFEERDLIKIINENLVIEDANLFFNKYSMISTADGPNRKLALERLPSPNINNLGHLISPRSNSSDLPSPNTVKRRNTNSSNSSPGFFSEPFSLLDFLVKRDSALAADTIIYDENEKFSQEPPKAKERYFIESLMDLTKRNIYECTKELRPIKTAQMKEIRHLFDKIIGPIYLRATDDIKNPELIEYFKRAIAKIMKNSQHNEGPTIYEIKPEKELAQEFPKSDKIAEDFISYTKKQIAEEACYNNNLYHYAIQQARQAQARIMMFPLRFFISDRIESRHLTQNKELKKSLEWFKAELKSSKNEIKETFERLEEYTADAGTISYKYATLRKLTTNAAKKNANKVEAIGDSFSCFFLISNLLMSKLQLSAESTQLMTEQVIAGVISKLKLKKDNPIHLDPTDFDFYLHKNPKKLLKEALVTSVSTMTLKASKDYNKRKHQMKIINDLTVCIFNFIGNQKPLILDDSNQSVSPRVTIKASSKNIIVKKEETPSPSF